MEASAEAIDDDWVSVSVEDLPDENCSIENLYMKRIRGEFCAPFSSLWYRRAASHWTEALPLGNGRLGAMLFGGTATETVELNEDSLWSGGPKDWNNPGAKDVLPAVREAVFAGHFAKATELSKDMLGAYAQVYEPLGTLSLLFSNPPSEEKVQEYVRQLDLDTAVASVAYTWSSENGGKAGILREAFVSQLDQVLAIRITTDYEEGVSLSVRLDSPLKQSVHVNDRGNQVVLIGRCRGDSPMGGNFIEREGKEGTGGKEATKKGVQEGVAFAAVIEVQLWNGGRVMEGQDAKSLDIVSAGGVLILVAGASSYEGPHVAPKDSSRDPLAMCEAAIGAAAEKNWEELLACHLADYQPLFRKMDLEFLGPKEEERAAIGKLDGQEEITVRSKEDIASDFCQIRAGQSPALETPSILNTHKTTSHSAVSRSNSSKQSGVTDAIISAISKGGVLPTDERLKSFQETRDPSLVTLLFQYGRYLLLSSSRPGSFVANLQGIWSQGLNPPWRGCPHLNINLEMNYWPAEVCNLVDSHRPLFELVKILAENGTLTAEVNYGLPGWVCHHQTDIWGQTGTTADDPSWALWPMGGAWLVLHLWEHYCFSPNQDFLRETAYPLLRGSALFLLNWLVEDPHSGNLLTCPSTSPEHLFLQEDGQVASVAMGATMDLSIINHVFSACIVANEILGDQDGDICTELKRARDRLLPLQVGKNGCLMEWAVDFDDPDPQHRHLSHLYGLYPGHSIHADIDKEIAAAAAKSVTLRGEEGPGWSTAWKIALWARLGNAKEAYRMVAHLFRFLEPSSIYPPLGGGGLYPNLFNGHPPFQIDGNLGFPAAVAEMLVQSRGNEVEGFSEIQLFPAFPWEEWPSGALVGLRVRGAVEVDLLWKDMGLVEVRVKCFSERRRRLTLLCGSQCQQFPAGYGEVYVLDWRLRVVKKSHIM